MKKGRNLPILVTFEIMNKEKRKEAMFQKGVFQCQSRLALHSSGTEAWRELGAKEYLYHRNTKGKNEIKFKFLCVS